MTLRSRSIRPLLLAAALWPAVSFAGGLNSATYAPEPSHALARDAAPAAPAFRHRVPVRSAAQHPRTAGSASMRRLFHPDSVAALVDNYVQDGWGSAVAVNPTDPTNAVVAFEEGWDFDPDIPLGSLRAGQSGWSTTAFPSGVGIYGGYPSQPWSASGNTSGEFYASMIRQDLYPTDNTHTILARTINNGATFSKFFELDRTTKQDRAMFDIDRTTARGGTSGPYDGSIYLCFDDWGSAGAGYVGSFLESLAPGDTVPTEVALSGTGVVPFRGAEFQPVAGLNDGQLFLVSNSITAGGATVSATFHELTADGASHQFGKSTISWAPAGRKLGATTRWGVNGHRIDERGSLVLDRSNGPRRGYLYFISNRNPNPADPTQDQGDLYLSVSVTRGANWTTARVPSQGGKTQFFPMIDVDGQGWIHVAFYQNETGFYDGGALNAGEVMVYYTVSRDGGQSWTPPLRVNELDHALNMEDPPLQLGSFDYDLLGDYMQLRATGAGASTAAYVGWTGYDQYRSDDAVGTKKQRIYATRVYAPDVPGASPLTTAALAAALVAAGALALFVRRRRA